MVLATGLGKSTHLPLPQLVQPKLSDSFSDEILYDARIHPEQYSNTLSAAQVKQLHKSIQYVCSFAVDHLADSSTFPKEWLFKHRWGKGKKNSSTTLPNGAKFVYLKVGGRTSCVVPSVQKKTGPVAKDVDDEVDGDEEVGDEEEKSKPKGGKKVSKIKKETDDSAAEPAKKATRGKKSSAKQEEESTENENVANGEASKSVTKANQSKKREAKRKNGIEKNGVAEDEEAQEEETKPASKKRKSNVKAETNGANVAPKKQKKAESEVNEMKEEAPEESTGRRRSGRASAKGV